MPIQNIYKTENEFGTGEVRSWASIIEPNTVVQAERISRSPIVDGHIALMPDAHFGYGPPIGTALKTKGGIIIYSVGSDIGCGMIAIQTNLDRQDFIGLEGKLLGKIRDIIPSGMGNFNKCPTESWKTFLANNGFPNGLENYSVLDHAMIRKDKSKELPRSSKAEHLKSIAGRSYSSLGGGNHFAELCQDEDGCVWFVLHSGSRGIGLNLAEAHFNISKDLCEQNNIRVEHSELSYLLSISEEFANYISDMLWCQKYAFSQRESMMDLLLDVVKQEIPSLQEIQRINTHHNYAENIESDVWLIRKGAINAEMGCMGIIPGSMGAATYIVKGLGNEEAYNTSPHGAGRLRGRGESRRTLSVEDFKKQMEGKFWQDRDAKNLIDEAPNAYKSIETVIADSSDLVETVAILSQFINLKGVDRRR